MRSTQAQYLLMQRYVSLSLMGANLRQTILTGANLTRANLSQATLPDRELTYSTMKV